MKIVLKIILFFVMNCCFLTAVNGQDWFDEDEVLYRPRFALKFAPLPFAMSNTAAIQFSGEAKTFLNQSIQIEYGYVNDFGFLDDNYDGFKLKTEYRFYNPFRKLKPRRSDKIKSKNFFIGVQYFRKEVDAKASTRVNRSNNSYQEILPLRINNITNSFFFVFGKVKQLKGRFYHETVLGIGRKNLHVTIIGLPEDASMPRNAFRRTPGIDLTDGKGFVGSMDIFFSFKIIYAFK